MDRLGNQLFFRGRVQCGTGDAIVFVSPDIVSALVGATELHNDGTFASCPSLFKQVVTMHVVTQQGEVEFFLNTMRTVGCYLFFFILHLHIGFPSSIYSPNKQKARFVRGRY